MHYLIGQCFTSKNEVEIKVRTHFPRRLHTLDETKENNEPCKKKTQGQVPLWCADSYVQEALLTRFVIDESQGNTPTEERIIEK